MEFLTDGILALTWQQIVMFAVGITLIWLAIKKGFEPALLLPMGFGAILVNLPFSGVLNQTLAGGIQANGVIEWLFHVGIEASEVMPILLFIGIGAMIDFGPLLSNPSLFLFGAGAQLGIFAAILLSTILGFDLKDAASIGIIGAADGPNSGIPGPEFQIYRRHCSCRLFLHGTCPNCTALCHPACHYKEGTLHSHGI